jgi:hypothetical protein
MPRPLPPGRPVSQRPSSAPAPSRRLFLATNRHRPLRHRRGCRWRHRPGPGCRTGPDRLPGRARRRTPGLGRRQGLPRALRAVPGAVPGAGGRIAPPGGNGAGTQPALIARLPCIAGKRAVIKSSLHRWLRREPKVLGSHHVRDASPAPWARRGRHLLGRREKPVYGCDLARLRSGREAHRRKVSGKTKQGSGPSSRRCTRN